MKSRELISGAAYGPEALKVIGEAFDKAWDEIAGHFGDDPREIEAGRLRLAEAVLSVAHEQARDVEALKDGALQAMALGYVPRVRLVSLADHEHSG